jgi:hypothetical protein
VELLEQVSVELLVKALFARAVSMPGGLWRKGCKQLCQPLLVELGGVQFDVP